MDDTKAPIYDRFTSSKVAVALTDTPVVMLIGPRQCGKTTLARQFLDDQREYITLDDDTVLEAARHDPTGFVRGLDRVTIDEVQRAPKILRAIKMSVDGDRPRLNQRFCHSGQSIRLQTPSLLECTNSQSGFGV